MLKKVLLIVMVLLLMGCEKDSSSTENIDVHKEYEDRLESLENDYISLNNLFSELNDELESKYDAIELLEKQLSNKNKDLENLNDQVKSLNDDVLKLRNLNIDTSYNNYISSLSYDVIQELDGLTTEYGYIKSYDKNMNTLEIDNIEFVAYYDEKRINELGIDKTDQIFAGSYHYNSDGDNSLYILSENNKFFVYNWGDIGNDLKLIKGNLNDYNEHPGIYKITLYNNKIIRITEIFID